MHRTQRDQKHVFVEIGSEVVMRRAGVAVAVFLHGDIQRFQGMAAQPVEGGVQVGGLGGQMNILLLRFFTNSDL